MSITKILPGLVLIVLFSSCQKEPTDDNPASPSAKVKTYTEDVTAGGQHTVTVFNLAYDANDRVISLVSASSPGDKFVYQYATASYTLDIFNSNMLSIHEVFFLNGNSLVDSTFQYNDTNDSSTEKYIYNSSKQLITVKEYEYSQLTGSILYNTSNYEYDGNGNVIRVTDDISTITYEYYTSLLNPLSFLSPYLPVNKNLVKTTSADYGGSTIVLSHTYTFDSSNRLSTETIMADSGEVAIKTYTYY